MTCWRAARASRALAAKMPTPGVTPEASMVPEEVTSVWPAALAPEAIMVRARPDEAATARPRRAVGAKSSSGVRARVALR